MFRKSLTPFDKTVLSAIGILLLLIGATIWRGDQTSAAIDDPTTANANAQQLPATAESHIVYLAVNDEATNELRIVQVNAPDTDPPNRFFLPATARAYGISLLIPPGHGSSTRRFAAKAGQISGAWRQMKQQHSFMPVPRRRAARPYIPVTAPCLPTVNARWTARMSP